MKTTPKQNQDTAGGKVFSLLFLTILFSIFLCAIFTGVPYAISKYLGWFEFGPTDIWITGIAGLASGFVLAYYVLKNNL